MLKTLKKIGKVFVWALAVLSALMMVFTVVSVSTFNRNDRAVFGYRAYIVKSDSMKDTFSAGDLIIVKEIDPAILREGDIITYISQNSNSFGEIITHKVREITSDAQGNPGFITYGTTTNIDDDGIVTYPYVMGVYIGRLPFVGAFFNYLKTPMGYVICILIPFLLLIAYSSFNTLQLYRHYREEQMQEERTQLEAARAENAKMLEELNALRAQLEKTPDSTEKEASFDDNV